MQNVITTDNLDDMDDLDMFADLEALLDEHNVKSGKAKVLKDKRVELTRTRDGDVSSQLRREILEMELEISYTPMALVARFTRQECACGASHTQLEGMFYHSKGSNGCLRWTRTEHPGQYKHLPHKTECVTAKVVMCVECCTGEGFIFTNEGED